MYRLLISYDLMHKGQNYAKLKGAIEDYSDSTYQPLESTIIAYSNYSAKEMRDKLLSKIDSNDKLYVVNITGKASSWHNLGSLRPWLDNHS